MHHGKQGEATAGKQDLLGKHCFRAGDCQKHTSQKVVVLRADEHYHRPSARLSVIPRMPLTEDGPGRVKRSKDAWKAGDVVDTRSSEEEEPDERHFVED
jgi:hypothetical protein